MLRKFLVSFFALTLLAVCSLPLMAQDVSSARGNLSGIVYDSTKSVVPGAQVTATGPIGSLNTTTGGEGSFLFTTLIPGLYTVRVQKQGFKVSEAAGIEVLINKTTSVQVTLEPGTITQTVEIVSSSLTIDTSASSINSDFADTFYQNIPIQRGVANLFYLAPGVASGEQTGNANPSISGGSGLENLYVADGVTINDPAYGGLGVWSRSYGALGSGINLSFVKEVQVKTAAFEPQYGRSTGGVVQIVTKSGGTSFHGAIAGYGNSRGMQTNFANADDPTFATVNKHGSHLNDARVEGDAEFGGYVPVGSLKDHLFFFGNFNPTINYEYWAPAVSKAGVPSGLFTIYNGDALRRTLSKDYAGKLTFKINNSHTIESSVFGDPNTTNAAPFSTLNSNNTSANSKWDYGTRNWVVRYNGALTSTWQVDAAFTWNWNHFTETPATNIYNIVDRTQLGKLGTANNGSFNAEGIGFSENYDSNGKSYNFDTSKVYRFGGQHTVMVGFLYGAPIYNDIVTRSGPRFPVPLTNADGSGYLSPAQLALIPAGSTIDATFSLAVDTSLACTLCPLMTLPAAGGGTVDVPVFLTQTRGTYSSGVTHSTGKYYTSYINDSWAMGTHATLNLGLRWEQQRINGNIVGANFKNMWEPRVSFIVDPKGDRKSKIYASFSRLAFVLPLDAALRSLSSESDLIGTQYAPKSVAGHVVLDAFGTVIPVPDSAHVLDGAAGGLPINTSQSAQSGAEPFQPNTRMEYNDEFVVGVEHEFRGGIFASVRYIDRRMKRVIEDFSGIPIEAAFAGLSQTYVIGNPAGTTDFVVNPHEIVFSQGVTYSGGVAGMPKACFDSNGNPAPHTFNRLSSIEKANGLAPQGSACFPSVNLNPWTDSSGAVLPTALFGGEVGADGNPDGFINPNRTYQAVEFEVNKALSHNWALVANWRIARLQGNYEGAFRNDNNQADPGISSLFDFTPGLLGLLGQQQGTGILNTDRKHVVNVYTTYVLDRSFMKGLVLGGGLKVQSGVPLTTIAAQQAYVNSGEVPVFARGDLGRALPTGTVDTHVEYPWKISERMTLKFGIDMFNIGNTKRSLLANQNVDLQWGILNTDFQKPYQTATNYFFVAPFSSRAMVRLEF